MKTLAEVKEQAEKREKAIRMYFSEKKSQSQIASILHESRQNIHNWIKAEIEARKKT